MKVVLVNPPHTAIGSRIPGDHLPPLGLFSIGGPPIDAGPSSAHATVVTLCDAIKQRLPGVTISLQEVRT